MMVLTPSGGNALLLITNIQYHLTNHAQLVHLEEFLHLVWAVAHDVVLFCWVANSVRVHTKLLLAARGVGPQQVHSHLLHLLANTSEVNLERAADLLDVLKFNNC